MWLESKSLGFVVTLAVIEPDYLKLERHHFLGPLENKMEGPQKLWMINEMADICEKNKNRFQNITIFKLRTNNLINIFKREDDPFSRIEPLTQVTTSTGWGEGDRQDRKGIHWSHHTVLEV